MIQQRPFGELRVAWQRQTHFTGRNGYLKCNGVQFTPLQHNNSVLLMAVNSRGDAAKCDIEIPAEAVKDRIPKPILRQKPLRRQRFGKAELTVPRFIIHPIFGVIWLGSV